MPGKVTLSGGARAEFLRGERDEPRMSSKIVERKIPRGIGHQRTSRARGELRRSVKPANSLGRSVRHCEAKVRFHNGDGKTKSIAAGGNGWHSDMRRYATTYLTRDRAGIDGERPEHFTVENGKVIKADIDAFLTATSNDKCLIEIFIPPYDGDKIKDFPGFTAAVVAQLERDWNTKLTWTAVVHEKHDVAHPVGGPKNKHGHLLVRGVIEGNEDLRISREYLSSTLRNVVQKELSAYPTNDREKGWRLGPMSEEERERFQQQMALNRPDRIARGWTKATEQELQQMQQDRTRTVEADRDDTKERRRDRTRGASMGDE